MFGVTLKTLTITSLFFIASNLQAADDIFKSLGTKPGKVKVVSENSEICTDGPFKLVGKSGEEVLMVGPVISFILPTKEKEIISKASSTECAEEAISELVKSELKVTTTVHTCPEKLKSNEVKVQETLSVSGTTIKYQRISNLDKKIECQFQWRAK